MITLWGKIKRVLTPTDAVAVLVILLGLIIGIFISEIAIRLIGISIAILGAVALFLMISQRLSEFVDSRYKPKEQQELKISIKQDTLAKHLVFEDFDAAFKKEDDDLLQNVPEKPQESPNEEGFRIVKKVSAAGSDISDFKQKIREIEDTFTIEEQKINDIEQNNIEKTANIIDTFEKDNSKLNIIKPDSEPSKIDAPSGSVIELSEQEISETNEKIERDNEVKKELYENGEINTASKHFAHGAFKEKVFDLPINVLMEDISVIGNEPKKEFEYLLSRVLMVIRSVTNTRTASFILVNPEKKELILESYVTDIPESITDHVRYPIENDIISQIIIYQKPEILTEINPSAELELLPYYGKAAGTQSFIGVPVFYNNSIIGVLCADTNILDAYDSITVGFLGHFTKLITALVHSYTEKYDLLQASKTLNFVNLFRDVADDRANSVEDIVFNLSESINNIFEFSTAGICFFEENKGGWHINTIINKGNFKSDSLIDLTVNLHGTLLGSAILNNQTLFSCPVQNESVRVHPRESNIEGGIFVAVPLKTSAATYGCAFVESINPSSLNSYDIRILEVLCSHSASAFEKLQFIEMLQDSVLLDRETGAYNPSAFYHRLEEEMMRAKDFQLPFTLCLLQIDKYASLDPAQYSERADKALYHVLSILKKHLHTYDIFGKADLNTFGILLIGMDGDHAKSWADKMRNEAAITVLEIEGKRFTVTISIGLADSVKADSSDSLVANARKMLDLSLMKTNCVNVY